MIWFIVFVFICGYIEQFDCASGSTDGNINDEQSEFIDTYCYELTPSSLDGSQLIYPMINGSKGTLKRSNITDFQPGIPFHLIIRLVDARTSRPLVGAYIYVWHANIYGNHSSLNRVRCSKRFAHFEKDYEKFQDNSPPGKPLNFSNEPNLRQDYGRSRSVPQPNEVKDYKAKDFNQFDELKKIQTFKSSKFNGSLYNQSNSFNQSYSNSSIRYSKLANSSYNFNDFKSLKTANKSRDSGNFTVSGNETKNYERDQFTQESTPILFNFENFTQSNTETYNSFTTEPVTYEMETDSQDFEFNKSEPYSYWNPTESATESFNNFTKVNNVTSKVNQTVEQKHYANETQRHFLQGYQITDFNGDVSFITIVPGWIANRSLHVNVHVYLDESQENATFVGQLYFPNEFTDKLKSVPMYLEANQQILINNYEDKIFQLNNGNSTLLTLETIGSGYQSIITLGIDPLKTIKP